MIELMMGRVICEVPELSGFHGKDLSDLKSFVTQISDSYRKPYARNVFDILRTTIIIGTADRKDGIIPSDTAGNRRWPVLDLPCRNNLTRQDRMLFLETNRKQLWAEGKELFLAGEELWWTDELQGKYGADHRQYERRDDLTETIRDKLCDHLGVWKEGSMTSLAVACGMMENEDSKPMTRAEQMRFAEALKLVGYQSKVKRLEGKLT